MMLKFLFIPRWYFALTALVCSGLLGFGYYLQYHDGLEPCPMCIFQRLCFIGVALVSAIAAVHGPARLGARVYGALVVVFAGIGAAIASRQVWLQHLPEDRVPECGPGLEFMLEMYPLAEVIRKGLQGTGECAAVDWTFLGASIAEWSLLCFVALIVSHVVLSLNPGRHNQTSAQQKLNK